MSCLFPQQSLCIAILIKNVWYVQVGFNKDGKLQAVDITMYANDGYVSESGWVVSNIVMFMRYLGSCCVTGGQ